MGVGGCGGGCGGRWGGAMSGQGRCATGEAPARSERVAGMDRE